MLGASETARWEVAAIAAGNDDTLSLAYPARTAIDDNAIAQNDKHVTSVITLTPGGSPADGDTIYFEVARNGTHANDDLTQSAYLLGIEIRWTIDGKNDD